MAKKFAEKRHESLLGEFAGCNSAKRKPKCPTIWQKEKTRQALPAVSPFRIRYQLIVIGRCGRFFIARPPAGEGPQGVFLARWGCFRHHPEALYPAPDKLHIMIHKINLLYYFRSYYHCYLCILLCLSSGLSQKKEPRSWPSSTCSWYRTTSNIQTCTSRVA